MHHHIKPKRYAPPLQAMHHHIKPTDSNWDQKNGMARQLQNRSSNTT
jgi:hypothetical protein